MPGNDVSLAEFMKFCQTAGLRKFLSSRDIEELFVKLGTFQELLTRWQRVQNLVSRETLKQYWKRHVYDSLQVVPLLAGKTGRIVDVGSGGGFPAVPAALALQSTGMEFHLVDSNQRKISFLRTVSRELDLDLKVHAGRIEEFSLEDAGRADIITSRATASLDTLFSLTRGLWNSQTIAFFHKGAEFGEELRQARTNWQFDVVCYPSKTDDFGQILELRNVRERLER